MGKKSLRKNLTMPPDWWAAFEKAAKSAELPLSEWVGEAAKKALPPEQRRKLSSRSGRGRPSKGS